MISRSVLLIHIIFKIKIYGCYCLWFWCKNKIKENKAHISLTESYLMLQAQTIDG